MFPSFPYMGEVYALLTAIVWAFSVILFKKSGETVHPLSLNLFKNTLAMVLIPLTMIILGNSTGWGMPADHLWIMLLSGILGIGLADTFFFQSLNLLGASRSAIVDCLYSPFVIILSIIALGERLTVVQILGALMIVSAVFSISQERPIGDLTRKNLILGIILGALAMLTNALGIVLVKPLLMTYPLLWTMMIRILGGNAVLLLILLFHPGRRKVCGSLLNATGWKYMLPGSFIGTYGALILWLAGMKFTQASTAAAINQTSNIFTFIFAAFFLKETINRQKTIGIVLGAGGVFLVFFG